MTGAQPFDHVGALRVGPELLAEGAREGPLAGRTFVAKDLFDVAGQRTGAGNPDFLAEAPVAERSAPSVEALVAAGATLWGKAHTDELAYSLTGTNVHYGTPVNVAAPGRVPGGSSCGSVAAVASGMVDLALGTDTGGSVRVPASYCGIVGLRPTHGRVSAEGLVPLAPSFDTVGWFTREGALAQSVGDVLLAPGGATAPFTRLVVAADAMAVAEPATEAALRSVLPSLGLPVEEVDVAEGDLAGWREAFRVLQGAEAWAVHGEWITRRRPHMGGGITARFGMAAAITADEVGAAQPVRDHVVARLADVLAGGGVLALPASSGPAHPLDVVAEAKSDLRDRTLRCTSIAGLAGAPALSLPLATVDGLPVGLSLLGPAGSDEALLDLAVRLC